MPNLQNIIDSTDLLNPLHFSTSAVTTILKSFDKGQGNTLPLVDKIEFIDNLTISYLNGAYTLKFQSEEHKAAYMLMLFYRDTKDRSVENIDKLFSHINSGNYLSLNHTDGNNSTVSVDKYAQYKTLFDSLGVTEVKSNGKGSKLTQLICNPTPETVVKLSEAGFSNITPLVVEFSVLGLKVELPKQAD